MPQYDSDVNAVVFETWESGKYFIYLSLPFEFNILRSYWFNAIFMRKKSRIHFKRIKLISNLVVKRKLSKNVNFMFKGIVFTEINNTSVREVCASLNKQ